MKNKHNIIKISAIIMAMMSIAGCVPSLQPFYTENDLITDSALLGTWIYKNGAFTFTFEQDKDNSYELTVSGGNQTNYYSARLMKLKNNYFLDIYPKQSEEKYILGKNCYVPAHNIAIVMIENNSLRLDALNPIVLEYLLKEKKILLSHEYFGNNILLTGSTSELQAFLIRYKDEKELFSASYELERSKP